MEQLEEIGDLIGEVLRMVELYDFGEMSEVGLYVNKGIILIDVVLLVIGMRSDAVLSKDVLLFFEKVHLICLGKRSNLVL